MTDPPKSLLVRAYALGFLLVAIVAVLLALGLAPGEVSIVIVEVLRTIRRGPTGQE